MADTGLKKKGFNIRTANLGYPRIGTDRELKKATESFWKGQSSEADLLKAGKELRKAHWLEQKKAGIDVIPSNDFSFYDQMLDMSCLLGAIPERYAFSGSTVGLSTYFAMARGIQEKQGVQSKSVPAMEMTKWLDTNYHYIVPEFKKGMKFRLSSTKPFDEYKEAKALGIETRPVIIGPVTYLLFGKSKDEKFDALSLLDSVLPVYAEILKKFDSLGVQWVQIDEPALVLELPKSALEAIKKAYAYLKGKRGSVKLCLATYFESIEDKLTVVKDLPVEAVHVDLVRAPKQIAAVLKALPEDRIVSLGVVDGRNIWKNDFAATLAFVRGALAKAKQRNIDIAPSCSLIHSPMDLDLEKKMDKDIRNWMAYAKQKISEIQVIRKALVGGDAAAKVALQANAKAMKSRKTSSKIHVAAVQKRLKAIKPRDSRRSGSLSKRRDVQRERLGLDLFPTTTIGSFPQTQDVRKARLDYKRGDLNAKDYRKFLEGKIDDCVRRQEKMGLDVLVHGEFERNDMVEYFGEQLEGFVFSGYGWVQSYGSRYVKPPIIFGDVSRPKPMTVDWYKYAQSRTEKYMKGMLTGPVTILQWSFVRNDQPRSLTTRQIALAIRDEVSDLEKAGAAVIQIDEAAFREGLPLKKKDWKGYLDWAVESFRLSSSSVKDDTQIHTHMCYSEFNDIIEAIADMDADVISIETSRSQMELLGAFVRFKYPSDIGPGVYDIHSPRVPSENEMTSLMKKATQVLPIENLWVNPDCGLKTRGWEETTLALENMVKTAKSLRNSYAGAAALATK